MNHFAKVSWSVGLLSPVLLTHIIGLSLLFIDIPGRLISICTIVAAAIHVKGSTVTDFNPIKRSLLRFSVVLLCINILILFTNMVGTLGFILPMGADVTVLVWLSLIIYVAIFLPALVVPILMMVLFKPIWSAVKGLLMCRRCRTRAHGDVSTGRTIESKEMPSTASTAVNTEP